VKLAASALLLPHWGGLARAAAGLACIALAARHEGTAPASILLLPFILALSSSVLTISALLARAGVARPQLDVLQFVVRWRGQEKELTPISIGASLFQLVLSIATLPIAKLLPPSVLYQPAMAPSPAALFLALVVAAASAAVACLAWSGRVTFAAPAEQQREAEVQG
jgi:hypothetical protein